ncbi:hypothetical protein MTO96_005576 [Rhipicephalus appendiculatus]
METDANGPLDSPIEGRHHPADVQLRSRGDWSKTETRSVRPPASAGQLLREADASHLSGKNGREVCHSRTTTALDASLSRGRVTSARSEVEISRSCGNGVDFHACRTTSLRAPLKRQKGYGKTFPNASNH